MTRRDEPRLVEVVLEEDTSPDGMAPGGMAPGGMAPDGVPLSRPGGTPGDATAQDGRAERATGARVASSHQVRRRPVAVVAALVLLVAVLGLTDVVAERRERAALAAVADVPGVVTSLGDRLAERWRLPRRSTLTGTPGRVVAIQDDALVGRDAGTGDPRWSVPLPGGGATCPLAVPSADLAGRLLCFGVGRPDPGSTDRVALHAVDAADGTVLAPFSGPTALLTGAAVEQDVVLLGVTEGRLTIARHELAGGTERWRTALAGLRVPQGPDGPRVHADAAVVAVEGRTGVVLDARDGRELGRWDGDPTGPGARTVRVVSHPGVGFGVWQSRVAGRWHAPDGTPGAELAGEPVQPGVDDGSAPGVVLLRSDDDERLHGVDVTSGDVLWERPAPARVLVRLDGHLVVDGDGTLESWDLRTGEVRWSTELEGGEDPSLSAPLTDGLRIAVPGDAGGGLRLTAFRVADGDRLWSSDLPPGTERVLVLGDRLAVVGRLGDDSVESVAVLG